jgi:hypothetical protein
LWLFFFFDFLLVDFGSVGLATGTLCNAHSTDAPHTALLSPTWLAPTRPDVKSPLMAGKVIGKVAVEFEEQA